MTTREPNRSSRWIVVALVLVILTAVGAGVVILVSQKASSHSMESLSSAFMREVAARAEVVTLTYLETGPRSLQIVRRLSRGGRFDGADDAALEKQFRSLLAAHAEIEMFNYGRPDGDFMMVKRMPDGSLSTKRVRRREGVAESIWQHENPAWGRSKLYADRREVAGDAYDPRSRPWYKVALEKDGLGWIDPYIYYSDRMPGIACAVPLYDSGGRLLGVVGADIGIAEISRLLAGFEIGSTGQAVILAADGSLIADPAFLEEGSEPVREIEGADRPELVLRRVEDSPGSVLAAAFSQRPSNFAAGSDPFTFEHRGTDYVARFETFPLSSDRSWMVGVLAPQEELLGPLRRDHRITLGVTLFCLILAIGLAAVLVSRAAGLEIELLKARTVEKQQFIEELETRNAEMERFAYTVSHDLKSPLFTIRGYVGMLEKDLSRGDDERIEGDLQRIHSAAGRMAQLLDEVLELSRVGRLQGTHEEVALGELAAEVAEHLDGPISRRGVDLRIEPGLPTVVGDRPRLLEVLQNLIDNACKFMGDQPRPRIVVGSREDGDGMVFYVRDNGIGIDPRYQEKIFGLFDRLDLAIEGTGVGLALVKRIVEVHGGRIWVESQGEGYGATFCYTVSGMTESGTDERRPGSLKEARG
ncbi:MAG: hypothetical protein GY719_40690 [bacterium]|nr:hypothetical protein [bacterium]